MKTQNMNHTPIIMDDGDAYRSDMEKLKRSNAKLMSALVAVEFVSEARDNGLVWVCPACDAFQKGGHFSYCPIKLALEDVDK